MTCDITVRAKSFILLYRLSGRARRLKIGRYPLISLADARIEGKKALLAVKEGKDPAYEKREAMRPLNSNQFELVVRTFNEDYAELHNRSWKKSVRILTREFVSKWRGRRITTISRPEVVSIIQAIVNRGSPVQATRALAAIRNYLTGRLRLARLLYRHVTAFELRQKRGREIGF